MSLNRIPSLSELSNNVFGRKRKSATSSDVKRKRNRSTSSSAEPVEAVNYGLQPPEAVNYALVTPTDHDYLTDVDMRDSTTDVGANVTVNQDGSLNFDAVGVVLAEQHEQNERKILDKLLAPALMVNGYVQDRNLVFVARPPLLPDREKLERMQALLNRYFVEVLDINTTVYRFVQTAPGDNAVGYNYFARYLHSKGVSTNPLVFEKCCDVMRSMYTAWADEAPKMVTLMLNLNGFNVLKEVMNVVNQSVYRFVAFVLKTENVGAPKYFYETIAPAMDEFAKSDLETKLLFEQHTLSNLYNENFDAAVRRHMQKFYTEDRETPYFSLGRTKLHTPILKVGQLDVFKIIK